MATNGCYCIFLSPPPPLPNPGQFAGHSTGNCMGGEGGLLHSQVKFLSPAPSGASISRQLALRAPSIVELCKQQLCRTLSHRLSHHDCKRRGRGRGGGEYARGINNHIPHPLKNNNITQNQRTVTLNKLKNNHIPRPEEQPHHTKLKYNNHT